MAQRQMQYEHPGPVTTAFDTSDDGHVWLSRLCGLTCGRQGTDEGPPRARGLFLLETNQGRFEADDLELAEHALEDHQARFVWRQPQTGLSIESRWSLCRQTGVFSRTDTLRNTGPNRAIVHRALARFVLTPDQYDIYSQDSHSCNENQGKWYPLNHGTVVLTCDGGRTTQGGTPYACVRPSDGDGGVAFHILPRGNWTIRLSLRTGAAAVAAHTSPPSCLVVELGHCDESLRLELPAGAEFELPEILLQPLPGGRCHEAAPLLHHYLLNHHFRQAKQEAALVYNVCADRGCDGMEVNRLGEQLEAARQIGCDVFLVDAGWYGSGSAGWRVQVGDWRENPDQIFFGRMKAFADQVRQAGLGFGLWMEPERNMAFVPAVKDHPEYFLPGATGCYYPDLANPQAYAFIRDEMARLIEDYELVWMKVDVNYELSRDPTGSEFALYYEAWYRMLDELRDRYPQTFFEGCASGGTRLDLNTLSHFDGHYLSDNMSPTDMLRIYQNGLLRYLPGRILKLAVMHPIHQTITTVFEQISSPLECFVAATGNIGSFEVANVDFVARVSLPGIFAVSGDIAGLSVEARSRLHHHGKFYKKWSRFMMGSTAHLLTPPRPRTDNTGWVAFQLEHPQDPTCLLFVYRLQDFAGRKWLRLQNLDPQRRYTVTNDDEPDRPVTTPASSLMKDGLPVDLPSHNSAAVFVLQPV